MFHFYLMLIPGMILVLLFNVVPMFGIVLAFKDFNPGKGIWASEWASFEHFQYVLDNPESKQLILNTVVIALAKMVAGMIVPVVFALLLNEIRIRWFKRTVQTIVYLPHFLSWVIIAGILRDLFSFNGIINQTLVRWFDIEPIMFLGSNLFFRPIIVGSDVWKEFGFSAIIYLAALTNINPTLYEAADIDGASRFQKLRFITLPGIASTIVLLATLSIQNILNAGFDQIFNLYNPLVYETADILDTYVYRTGFLQAQYEVATAIGLFKSFVSMALIITAYKLASKYAGYRIF
jgi:putative aldouronate transport system permease protein